MKKLFAELFVVGAFQTGFMIAFALGFIIACLITWKPSGSYPLELCQEFAEAYKLTNK